MFTGIIETMAEVQQRTDSQLKVSRPQLFVDIAIGSSISVSGVCLSVIAFDEISMTFDVIPETFKCTKLGSLEERDKVNLERAMLATDRFEGHIVQGHTESVGVVKWGSVGVLLVEISDELLKYIVPKGSISLDGVSLTVASKEENKVTVALIPHTLANTTLGLLKDGDQVNIETDVMVRSLLAR
ncbi:MAG: riboflavin synthase [Kiritimatiellales bacterium]|nr:riboflavin synthase [Kiritimatiellales bacterium]